MKLSAARFKLRQDQAKPLLADWHAWLLAFHLPMRLSKQAVGRRDLADDGGSEHAHGNRQVVVARAQALGRPS